MSQSRRERLLAFVISVTLCCMMSGSLSLMAKKSREESAVSTRTARLATPHEDIRGTGPGGADPGGSVNGSIDVVQLAEQGFTGTVRTARPLGGNIVTAAILCLAAAMACAITAVGGLLLLRGPRGGGCHSEDEDSDQAAQVKTSEMRGCESGPGIGKDDLDGISAEDVV